MSDPNEKSGPGRDLPRADPPDDHWGEAGYQRLHRGVQLDPESVWDDLRTYLCSDDHDPFDLDAVTLVEDLMFWHAEAFVDRLETLVQGCSRAEATIAWASVEGTAAPGIDRFLALRERLLDKLVADGRIRRGDLRPHSSG